MIRDTVGIVCLADHENGVPHTMSCMSTKEGEGERCELKTARKLIEQLLDLNHKLVIADALHAQDDTARSICAKGGDYLIQIKNNRKPVRALAEKGMSALSPFLPSSKKNTDAKPSAKSP